MLWVKNKWSWRHNVTPRSCRKNPCYYVQRHLCEFSVSSSIASLVHLLKAFYGFNAKFSKKKKNWSETNVLNPGWKLRSGFKMLNTHICGVFTQTCKHKSFSDTDFIPTLCLVSYSHALWSEAFSSWCCLLVACFGAKRQNILYATKPTHQTDIT